MDKIRVLVVDDDELARAAITDILRAAQVEVFELPSAIGITMMVRTKRIDAIVLDVNMPEVTGDKVAKMLRGHRLFDGVAMVLLSERNEAELAELAAKVQVNAVVTKSTMHTKLVPTLRHAVATCQKMGKPRR